VGKADAVVAINMIHVSPWRATEGLMAGAARVLSPSGLLYLYGPFHEAGARIAASNAAFDADLQARDPAWGMRDLGKVAHASHNGLRLTERIRMPVNNLSVVFRRSRVVDRDTRVLPQEPPAASPSCLL